ncbi:unnamed protein product, partial [Rotaria magnacalcarata]
PPDIPEQIISPHDYHRLPSMSSHQNDTTARVSTHTLHNDEHNGSFEDEEMDDEHIHAIDHPDGQYKQQLNVGAMTKAYALYDFNGKCNGANIRLLVLVLFLSENFQADSSHSG